MAKIILYTITGMPKEEITPDDGRFTKLSKIVDEKDLMFLRTFYARFDSKLRILLNESKAAKKLAH